MGPTVRRSRLRRTLGFVAIGVLLAGLLIAGIFVYRTTRTNNPGGCVCGPPVALSSATAGAPFDRSAATYDPYSIWVQSVSSGITPEDLAFQLEDRNGTATDFAYVGMVDVSGCWIGSYSGGWNPGLPSIPPPNVTPCGKGDPSLATQLNSGDELILVTTVSISSHGYSLTMSGHGSFAGTVAVAIP